MENKKPQEENSALEIKPASHKNEHGETAALREVSEVRIDDESGTITLKLTAKN